VDVREDTTGSDGHTAQKLVELLVVADSKLDVAGDDAGLLVVASGVPSQLENFSRQILEDSGQVHGGTRADAGRVTSLLEEAGDTAYGELETSLGGTGHTLLAGATATFAFASHC
jgi:hypothetical protein